MMTTQLKKKQLSIKLRAFVSKPKGLTSMKTYYRIPTLTDLREGLSLHTVMKCNEIVVEDLPPKQHAVVVASTSQYVSLDSRSRSFEDKSTF